MATDNSAGLQRAENAMNNANHKQDVKLAQESLVDTCNWTDNDEGNYNLASVTAMQAAFIQLNALDARLDDVFDRKDSTLLPTGPGLIRNYKMRVGTNDATGRGYFGLASIGELYPFVLCKDDGKDITITSIMAFADGSTQIYLSDGYTDDVTPFNELLIIVNGVEYTLGAVGNHYEITGAVAIYNHFNSNLNNNLFITVQALFLISTFVIAGWNALVDCAGSTSVIATFRFSAPVSTSSSRLGVTITNLTTSEVCLLSGGGILSSVTDGVIDTYWSGSTPSPGDIIEWSYNASVGDFVDDNGVDVPSHTFILDSCV